MGQNICNRSDVGDKHLATGTGYLINSIYVIVHLGVVVKLLRIRLNIKRAHDVVQLLFNFSLESLMVAYNIIVTTKEKAKAVGGMFAGMASDRVVYH